MNAKLQLDSNSQNGAHGADVYIWPDGQRLVGTSLELASPALPMALLYVAQLALRGTPNGSGHIAYCSGDRYVCSFKDRLADGEGGLTWYSGDTYKGSWRLGEKQGPGVYTWANGDRWKGIYKADHQSKGEMFRARDRSLVPARGQ